jgi:hypothetical protein
MATIRQQRSTTRGSGNGGRAGRRWQWRVVVKGQPPAYGTCPTKECARECAKRAEEPWRCVTSISPTSHKREVSQEVNARMEEWLAGSRGEPAAP